jgi:hypothetical protein
MKKDVEALAMLADRRAITEQQIMLVALTRAGYSVLSFEELYLDPQRAEESFTAIYTAQPRPVPANGILTGTEAEQRETLFGPAGKADHDIGERIMFANAETNGLPMTGIIHHVRAPGTITEGGPAHPAAYIVLVDGDESVFPHMIYLNEILEETLSE